MNETTTSPTEVLEAPPVVAPKRRGRPPKAKPAAEIPPVAAEHAALTPEPTKDALAELEQEAKHFTKEELEGAFTIPAEMVATVPLADETVPSPPVEAAPPTVAPTAGLLYVKKVQAGMPFFVNKVKLNFEMLGNNVGVGIFNESTQADKCEAIRKAAQDRRGGVVVIDEPTYQSLKKKLGPFIPAKSTSPLKVFRPNDHLPKLKTNLPASAAAASVVSNAATTGTAATGAVGGSSAPVKFTPNTRRFGPRPIPPPPPLAKRID